MASVTKCGRIYSESRKTSLAFGKKDIRKVFLWVRRKEINSKQILKA
jgi:hypothetical protein